MVMFNSKLLVITRLGTMLRISGRPLIIFPFPLLEDLLCIILSIAALGSIGADIVSDLHGAKPVQRRATRRATSCNVVQRRATSCGTPLPGGSSHESQVGNKSPVIFV